MKIVTFDDIITINNKLNDLGFKLSLKDACGAQSMAIRSLEDNKEITNQVYEIIEAYFKNINYEIEYSNDKKYIFIKK